MHFRGKTSARSSSYKSSYILTTLLLAIFIETTFCRNIKSESTSVPEGHSKAAKKYFTTAETPNRINVTLQRSNAVTEDEASILLAKDSYCTCKCCRPQKKGQDICRKLVRYDLPEDFKCPKKFCTNAIGNDCTNWNKHRCAKACFCQKCKGRLPQGDGRCSGELQPAAGCLCRGHEEAGSETICTKKKQGLASVWHFLTAAKMSKKFLKCQMGCFCNTCSHTTLSQVFKGVNTTVMCKAYPSIPGHCKMPCPPCPDHAAVSQARQTLQDVWRLQGSHGG
ncbi:uncharacterized protein LOC120327141 [Styela clava]